MVTQDNIWQHRANQGNVWQRRATYGNIGQFSAIEHNQTKQKQKTKTIGFDTIEINLVFKFDGFPNLTYQTQPNIQVTLNLNTKTKQWDLTQLKLTYFFITFCSIKDQKAQFGLNCVLCHSPSDNSDILDFQNILKIADPPPLPRTNFGTF